uniref:DUF659 domain-containing protein n=1 Tax=Arundo donax TaxID=35708 RepID=A0A0A9C5X0_ARUDO
MAKRKMLYWTPCAAHCIDLMLEDFEKKIDLHKTTIQKGRKNINLYIHKNYASFMVEGVHRRKGINSSCSHKICHSLLNTEVTS